jgi:hypothetical protein
VAELNDILLNMSEEIARLRSRISQLERREDPFQPGSPSLGSGTVTSVSLSAPSILSVSGSPITTSGTLGLDLASQSDNTIFAAPNGSSGVPTFRTLVANDIPALDTSKITTGTLPVARGGTGVDLSGTGPGLLKQGGVGSSITVGTLTDIEHGTRGGGTLHTVATTSVAGFLSATDKSKLDGIGAGASVSSVTLALPSIFSVAGSPITSAGTITATLATQAANTVFAGPSSGGAAAPTFRTLVANDIPALDTSKITTGTLPVARGGTGATTLTSDGVLLGNGTAAIAATAAGSANQVLRIGSGGGAPSFGAIDLSAAAAVSGALAKANQHAQTAYLDASNTFTAAQTMNTHSDLAEIATPATPSSGFVRLFGDTNNELSYIGDGGQTRSLADDACQTYRSTAQSIATSTLTLINFDQEAFDPNNLHDNVVNNTRITARVAGVYLIIANIEFAANAVGRRVVQIYKNSIDVIGNFQLSTTHGTQSDRIITSCIALMAANDFVQCRVFQDSGGALNVQATTAYSPYFSMVRIASA